MSELITSVNNPRVRNLMVLMQKSRERRKQNLVVVEGLRETSVALTNGFQLRHLYVCPDVAREGDYLPLAAEGTVTFIGKGVFEKLAYREGSDGCIALLEARWLGLSGVKLRNNPLVIVLEAVEKPGNLGAILRTADAADVDAVIVCDPLTDIYNPNVIRSGIGCVFSRQVVACSSEDAQQWLRENGIRSYAAELKASSRYHLNNYTGPTAFVMGTEADGLTQSWIDFCDERVIIPMLGSIDSLNVSVSTAVLVFEAKRQRGFD
ncbi:MAG: RNA methyltransferase [Bacteroidales bacterium]|jgi:TrmH family RNA methyltransferase|nr:RNA methyltransferase [Bacteroidales bacterium]